MADEQDVISQADALMRRHRSFVARSAQDRPEPATAVPAGDSDLPVLTEIVADDELAPHDMRAVLDALGDELDAELSSWLIEVLPAAVANASQQILAELDAKARNTLQPRLRAIIKRQRDLAQPQAAAGHSL
jgi:hypothetical protein